MEKLNVFDNFLQCIVSLGRINNYINSEDLDTSNVSRETRDGGCQVLDSTHRYLVLF